MKKLILTTTLLSLAVCATSSEKPIVVQVKSRAIQADKVSVRKSMTQKQILAPTRHQTVLTKNADGSFSYQCKQKHNHTIDTNQVNK
jgi:hypothetical protein